MSSKDQTQIKILVVTEDPIALESASAILEEAGYAIQSALEEKDGGDSARQSRPDLLLMDMERIESCLDLVAESSLGSLPVLYMATDLDSRVIENAGQAVAADFIHKPLNAIELLWRIGRLIKLRLSMEAQNETQKYRELLETAADVCHKLNQPLQYVMGTVQFLLMDMSAEDKLFDRLDMIRQKAELMGDITRKLTSLTRQGAGT